MTQPRIEKDSLGELELPADALYGINTARALANFPLTGRPIATWPAFTHALATVKQAAALANRETGSLAPAQADAISAACEEVKAGRHDAHLALDVLEGSGGTSTNMNVNEVIANVVARASGRAPGDYSFVHPNDHVNLGQSTNDVVPTALKLAVYTSMAEAVSALGRLADAFRVKRDECARILRLGRTCLQDAQPMSWGQALGGYEAGIRRHAEQLDTLRTQFLTVPLGGTAIGTGFGSGPHYKKAVFRHLSSLFGAEVKPAANAFDGMQNMDACARLSAELRNTGNTLWKVSNDLIILSSGPNGGVNEVSLPPVQAGSSIMPGKVNPVIPMAVAQAALAVTGNDTAVALACQQGMLEVNHFELLVCDRLLESIRLLTRASDVFAKRCVEGMRANEEVAREHLLRSSALATALVPTLGYARVAGIVRAALEAGRPFVEVAVEEGHLNEQEVMAALERSVYAHEGK
ncbi:hypothetical protein VUR80DRAFT_2773 [Thermomyces stellatus]